MYEPAGFAADCLSCTEEVRRSPLARQVTHSSPRLGGVRDVSLRRRIVILIRCACFFTQSVVHVLHRPKCKLQRKRVRRLFSGEHVFAFLYLFFILLS